MSETHANQSEWKCKRCTHTSSSKSNLLKHLRNKTPCTVTKENIHVDDYIAELLKKEYNDKTYDCPNCNAKFNAYQNRHRHLKTCKKANDKCNLQQEASSEDKIESSETRLCEIKSTQIVVDKLEYEFMKHKLLAYFPLSSDIFGNIQITTP